MAGANSILKEGAVDLAIPGSESTARIVKMVGENTGEHFASETEAQAVAEKVKDKSWVKDNCGICGNSPMPLNTLAISKKPRRRDDDNNYSLSRRGNMMASCCRLPHVTEVDDDTPIAAAVDILPETNDIREAFDPREFEGIKEAGLVPPPVLTMRNKQTAKDIESLSHDLNTLSTGLIQWSPEVTNALSSTELFSKLRKLFSKQDESGKYYYIGAIDRGNRQVIRQWRAFGADPDLKPIYDWIVAAKKDAIDTVIQLKGLQPQSPEAAKLRGEVEIFHTAPIDQALEGFDERGWHIDGGMMQFAIADVPGLIVGNGLTKQASRLATAKDAWHLLKAFRWDLEASFRRSPDGGGPTFHTVFGPEMAKEGRVSVLITVG